MLDQIRAKKRYRISTHPDLIICDKKNLLTRVEQDISLVEKERILSGNPSINPYIMQGGQKSIKTTLYWNWRIEEIAEKLPPV